MTWTNRGWNRFGSAYTEKRAGVPVDGAPVADSQSVSVLEDGYIAITLTATDPQGDPLTYAVLSGPSNGVLTGTAPNLIYTPTPDYFGSDSFTFQADDGTNLSNIATVSITVININDAPIANPQSVSVLEDGYIAITLTATDPEGDPLTYAVLSGPSNGVLTGTAPNLIYTPTPNYFGSDSFTFIANDGYLNSNIATVSITVINVNDAPTADAQSVVVDQDGYLAITLTGSDPEGNPLTYAVTSGPSNGVLTGTAPNLTYTPTAAYVGPDSFTFVVNDGYVDSAPATVSIDVQAVFPVATLAADFTVSATIPSELTFSRASTGTYYDSAGILQTAATDTPRFTHDPHTLAPLGLLVEQSSTNAATSGMRLDNWQTWFVGRITDSSLTLAPDGAQTATYVSESGSSNYEHALIPSPASSTTFSNFPLNQRHTFSMYAKAGTRNLLAIRAVAGAQTQYLSAMYDLNTGIATHYVGTTFAGYIHDYGMEQLPNGWWRIWLSYTLSGTGLDTSRGTLRACLSDGTLPTNWGVPIYVPSGDNNYLFMWGAQIELNTDKPSSAILTTGTSATRAADALDVSSTTGWYNEPEWTMIHDGKYNLAIDSSGSLASGTWDLSSTPIDNDWLRVRWSKELGIFVAVADGPGGTVGSPARVLTSVDGVNWVDRIAAQSGGLNSNWHGLAWSPDLGIFVAVAYQGSQRVMTSPDGITWTIGNASEDSTWVDVAWSPDLGLFAAVATSGTNRLMTSPDGITWTSRSVPSNVAWRGITWAKELGKFVAVGVGTGNGVMTSTDGITWSAGTPAADDSWAGVTWSPELGLLVAVAFAGTGSRFMTSPDGITWTARTSPSSTNGWREVAWSSELGLFVAVANSGTDDRIAISSDGVSWTGVPYWPTGTPGSSIDAVSPLRSPAWSPQLGVFAIIGTGPNGQRARVSSTDSAERRLMRYRSIGATDTWVTGSAPGFLGSGINEVIIARFAYYDTKLNSAQLAALGV